MRFHCTFKQQPLCAAHCEGLCDALGQGLINRKALYAQIEQLMQSTRLANQGLLLAVLDLDDFARVQSRLATEDEGDHLLHQQAQHLCQTLSDSSAMLAWLGGDEFLLLVHALQDVNQGLQQVKQAMTSMSQLYLSPAAESTTVSVGITVFPQGGTPNPDLLLRQAQAALYQAKAQGKDRYCFYDPVSEYQIRTHQRQLDELKRALQQEELRLYYQPKVNLVSGEILGLEALIRWQHPTHGLMAPHQFLPLLEGEALELDVGRWVLTQAVRQVNAWLQASWSLPVSINASGNELQSGGFVQHLAQTLAAYPDVPPAMLEIEILESSVLSNLDQVCQIIAQCQQLGVHFALDDFGTGYSSLSYLKQLPATTVKIDQSFVRRMLEDANDLAILKGVISLSQVFERRVLAEGVESLEHALALVDLGCTQGQGYGIARPMPADEVLEWCRLWLAGPWCCRG